MNVNDIRADVFSLAAQVTDKTNPERAKAKAIIRGLNQSDRKIFNTILIGKKRPSDAETQQLGTSLKKLHSKKIEDLTTGKKSKPFIHTMQNLLGRISSRQLYKNAKKVPSPKPQNKSLGKNGANVSESSETEATLPKKAPPQEIPPQEIGTAPQHGLLGKIPDDVRNAIGRYLPKKDSDDPLQSIQTMLAIHPSSSARLIFEKKMPIAILNLSDKDSEILFPLLTYLDLNGFNSTQMKLLEQCTNVQHLSSKGFKDLSDEDLEKIVKQNPNIKSLNLTDCSKITDKGLECLKGMENLTSLSLHGCELITNEGLMCLSSLTKLEHLDLACCTLITDEGLNNLKGLTNLTQLSLSYCNQITDEGLEFLSGLEKLTTIRLAHCNITGTGFQYFERLKALASIDLYESKVSSDNFFYLRKVNSDIDIMLG